MQIWQRFRGYRLFIFLVLFLSLVILFFSIILFKQTPRTFAQFAFYLLSGFAFFNLVVFLITLLGITDSIKVVKAIRQMLDFTERIREGNFEAKIDIERRDEVGDLADNLDLMRKNLKKSFESITEEKEKASSIVQNVGDALLVIDEERKIALLNPAAEILTGYKQKDIQGKKYFEIFKFFDRKNEKFICQMAGDKKCPIEKAISLNQRVEIPEETQLINKYEKKIEIAGNISPFFLKNTLNSYIIAFHDVTTEREIDRMKSEFISITSHQLRTPLSSIRWYAEMMLAGDTGKLNEKQTNFLNDLHESTITAVNLINNLLDVQRIEGGAMRVSLETVQLEENIEGVISTILPLAVASNAEITKNFGKELLPKVKADPKKLSQVFLNIISNAITYNIGKGEIIINLQKSGENIVFSCKDSGIGIPLEEQRNIFKKFFRASNTAGVGAPGSGIGLYICKVYVEEMKGKIWFESKGINKGTTFYVSLPIA